MKQNHLMVTVTKHLPIALSAERREELLAQLVEDTNEYNRLERIRKEIGDEQGKMMKKRRTSATACADMLVQGVEMLPVPCEQLVDLTKNSMTVRRLDNKEIVSERALTGEEREELTKNTAQGKKG